MREKLSVKFARGVFAVAVGFGLNACVPFIEPGQQYTAAWDFEVGTSGSSRCTIHAGDTVQIGETTTTVPEASAFSGQTLFISARGCSGRIGNDPLAGLYFNQR